MTEPSDSTGDTLAGALSALAASLALLIQELSRSRAIDGERYSRTLQEFLRSAPESDPLNLSGGQQVINLMVTAAINPAEKKDG